MTVRHRDVEYAFDDPEEGWFGAAQPADAEPEPPSHAAPADDDTDRWFVPATSRTAPVATQFAEAPRGHTASTWESRISNSGAWDFKATSGSSGTRSKVAVMAAAIVATVAAVVGVVLVLLAPADEESSPAPTSESAAPPAPTTSAAPVMSSVAPPPPLPPALPPPPPPPSAEQVNPPVVTREYTPNYQTPDEPRKPQTNVTRAPMSATPPPPPRPTDRGRATPGESGHHGFFG